MFRKAKRDLTIEEQLARGPIDLPFLTLVVLLTLVGLVMLLSASYPSAYYNLDASIDTGGNPYYYFQRQLAFAVAGLVAMFIVSKILPWVYLSSCCCWCLRLWAAAAVAPGAGSRSGCAFSLPRWLRSVLFCFFPRACPNEGIS